MGPILALLIVLALFLGGLIRAVLSRLLTDEFKAWTPWLVERITRRAICKLPEENRERFEEEWRGHLNDVPGEIGKLLVAVGFLRGARKMSSILRRGRSRSSMSEIKKRVFDLAASTTLIILLAPLMVSVGLLVKWLNGGPILLRRRVEGLNGQRFVQYRFYIGTAWHQREAPGEDCARPRPKLTRTNRFLQELKLDELPMLFNVLRGDMTIVGPRPKHLK
jgi:hypothetical protein